MRGTNSGFRVGGRSGSREDESEVASGFRQRLEQLSGLRCHLHILDLRHPSGLGFSVDAPEHATTGDRNHHHR